MSVTITNNPSVVTVSSSGLQGATGPGYAATSTTSFALAASGSKAFTTQQGLAYSAGARIRATSASDVTKWMEGVVTAYSGTTLTVTMDDSSGSGTFADWNINLAGESGVAGGGASAPSGTGLVHATGGAFVDPAALLTNADVDPAAAIAWTKLSKSGAVPGDVGAAATSHAHAESDVTGLVSDLAGKAPATRSIATTAPLTGGGDLSSDRTLGLSVTPANPGGAVALQATTPGTAQTGSLNLSGTVKAGALAGPLTGDVTGNVTGTATPLAHASTHAAAGSDPLTISESQVTGLTSDLAAKEATANKGAASGYASLDGSTKVPIAQLPTGSSSTTVAIGNDARLSDARTPTAHAASHNAGGGDALAIDAAAGTGSLRTLGTSSTSAAAGNDARLSDARTPTAHAASHNAGGGDALAIDAAAATGSLRTLGTSSTSAAAGNDARLSDARTPTAHAASHNAGGGDALAIDAAAGTGSLRTLGTGATAACAGNDGRLSDARTPTAHTSSHKHGGGDEVATATPAANAIPKAGAGGTLAVGWVPALVGDSGSGGTAGLVPAPAAGDASKFLKGNGTWASVPGGGDALVANPLSQFAATTSAQLAGVLTDEEGSGGGFVRATSPNLTTPNIGVATATSVNKVAITAPATSATLTIADGATLTASATATVSGTNTGDQTDAATLTTGTLAAGRLPALTGDVTSSAGSAATTLANIPTGTPMAGSLLATAIAAPATPAAGKGSVYVDSTSKALAVKNDAGVVTHTVKTKAAVANQFVTSIDDDGTVNVAQPAASGVTGLAAVATSGSASDLGTGTLPIARVADGAVTLAKLANLAQDQFIGRTTASTGVPETATITAAARTVLDDTTVAAMLATLGGVGPATTDTLTNKRITRRTGTTTSSATPTINTDNVDFYSLTAQAADITSFSTNLSGTPTTAQTLWIAITGTASRAITWGASFAASTVALPTTTVGTARLDVGFIWDGSVWRCVATA